MSRFLIQDHDCDDMPFAVLCATNVCRSVDRRSLEAWGLAKWVSENASNLGLADEAIPNSDGPFGVAPRHGVPERDWQLVLTALSAAATSPSAPRNESAGRWVEAITAALGLDSIEQQILALALYYKTDRRVARLFDCLSECRGRMGRLHRDPELFALLLKVLETDVEARLKGGAKLLDSGVLQLERDGGLDVLERLKSLVRQGSAPEADLYGRLIGPSVADPLPWDSFAYLGREAEIAAAVLRASVAGRETGINVLLYGPPGTGKTSFAATLAARVGARLRPVLEADEFGEEPSRGERLSGLRLAQRLVVPGDTVLLFDEAEDLFTTRAQPYDDAPLNSRVFIHRLLERVAVPVIWTANDISVLGPAVLRRMTMCLELRVPNLATRTLLWRRMGDAEGVVLAEADAARLARMVPTAPAVASAALRATRLAGGGADTARLIVEGIARAVHGGGLPAPEPEQNVRYDPSLVNVDCDLLALADDLVRPGAPRAVSLLLSGPPGAGKSAWVRYLANRMGLPVLRKRASDLLDAFLGGTEQNIAAAFAEARDAQAFLVFDEADSLLLERADAARSWEISQVNEMLTWMENHALPFACTTNLLDRLDRASLRRFLIKLRFDWLTTAQARLAFRRFFGLDAPAELEQLTTLTPADFELVRRRAAMQAGKADVAKLLRLLQAEGEGRVGGQRPVGYGR